MSTAAESAQVVVVGSINADLIVRVDRHPIPGETLLGKDLTVLPGGKGANQALASALLGSRTAFVGAIGTDEYSQVALSGLSDASVDLHAVTLVPGGTGVAVVTVGADGANSIVVIPGANSTVDGASVQREHTLIESAAVVVLQGEIPRSGIEQAAKLTKGRLIVNLAPVVSVDRTILLKADPLVVNEHEAKAVCEMLGAEVGIAEPGDPADESVLVRCLLDAGVPSVVVTLGSRGALVGMRAAPDITDAATRAMPEIVAIPSAKVKVVDTTGAGDAFVGALAHGFATGEDLVTAARTAALVGAFAVQKSGAQPSYPRRGEALPAAQQDKAPPESPQVQQAASR